MITPELIDKTAQYVKLKTYHEPAGHDWFHIERVWRLAKYLQSREGGDLPIIEMATLLHDVGTHNYHEFDEDKGALALFGMMDILEIEEEVKRVIIDIVNFCKFKGDETVCPKTLEARIVQDANWLDSLGAIGVARTFAAGGYMGRPIHDPGVAVRSVLSKFSYQKKKRQGTSVNSFFEKAYRLPQMMNTETARKMAETRVAYMKAFVEQFLNEHNGE